MSEYFEQPLGLEEILNRAEKYILQGGARLPAAYHFGQAEILYDAEHRPFIDFACADDSLGHGEADIVATIHHQSDRLLRRCPDFHSQERSVLAEAFVTHTFPGKVHFCDSAMETRLACMRLLSLFSKANDRDLTIISVEGGSPGFDFPMRNTLDADKRPFTERRIAADEDVLERELAERGGETCALLIDPIRFSAGIRPVEKSFALKAHELAQEYGILLVFDETELAPGRSGSLFAYDAFGIEPDVLLLSRGLCAGFSLGVLMLNQSVVEHVQGSFPSDQGISPVVARTAHEVLRLLVGREVTRTVGGLSEFFVRRITDAAATMPIVHEVRGMGLFIGVELKGKCDTICDELRRNGLLVSCANENTLAILPPLNMDLERSSEGLDILERVLREATPSQPHPENV